MKAARSFTTILYTGVIAMCAALGLAAENPSSQPQKLRVYIGTYTGGSSEGIYTADLDLKTGKLSEPKLAAKTVNPSFVALHPTKDLLYAVSEISEVDGKKTGAVAAFQIEDDGSLTLLNRQPSEGSGPCHVSVDRTGRCVLVANYGGGSVASLPIQEDGRLGPAASAIQHEGKSVNPRRQEKPHAHSINVDADNRFAVAADLGLDKLLVYRLDAEQAKLSPNDPPSVSVAPGAGPRHFAFHPDGKRAFVINELDSTLTSLAYDADKGTFKVLETVSTLPKEGAEGNSTAEVQVHPSGKFVYGSNRGHNSIAMFAIGDGGEMNPLGHQSTGGKTPRNFGVDPTGQFLIAANQDSENITVFRIDGQSGKLQPTGQEIKVGKPVCIKFRAID